MFFFCMHEGNEDHTKASRQYDLCEILNLDCFIDIAPGAALVQL